MWGDQEEWVVYPEYWFWDITNYSMKFLLYLIVFSYTKCLYLAKLKLHNYALSWTLLFYEVQKETKGTHCISTFHLLNYLHTFCGTCCNMLDWFCWVAAAAVAAAVCCCKRSCCCMLGATCCWLKSNQDQTHITVWVTKQLNRYTTMHCKLGKHHYWLCCTVIAL